MNVAALVLLVSLAQEPEVAEPVTEDAPANDVSPAPAAQIPVPPAPSPFSRPKGADEISRLIQRLPNMSASDRTAALDALMKQFGQTESNPVLPGAEVDLDAYLALPPAQQAQVMARGFFVDLIAGNTAGVVARTGVPFFMEGRRVERPEEVRAQWGKSLQSRRVDLLKLYSVEVLLPAEMEKKYGKPPARLSGWNWKAPGTYFAVGNLSGHPTILLLHQVGAAWQIVGFHD